MNAFEKIRFRLQDHCESGDCRKFCHECDFKTALSIVSEVEAEYGNGWIDVKDRLPEKDGYYLTCDHKGNIHVFFIVKNLKKLLRLEFANIIHGIISRLRGWSYRSRIQERKESSHAEV